MAQTLAAIGYRVVVLAGLGEPGAQQPTRVGGRPVDGLEHIGLGEYSTAWSSLRKLGATLIGMGALTSRWLSRQSSLPAAVIVYGTPLPVLWRMAAWCRRRDIPLIADVVEWYNGSHMAGGWFGPLHLSNEIAMRWMAQRCDGIIGISGYLCRYFAAHRKTVIRVPPTLDTQTLPWSDGPAAEEGPLRLVYAGVPGKKDLLGHVLEAIARVDASGSELRLKLLGPTIAQLRTLWPDYPASAIEAAGRHGHADVLREVAQAHFSVLLRSDERYANAGFPTKVVESMGCGTPVICNLTSDLREHVRHGVTGIVCRDSTVEAFVVALREALSLRAGRFAEMRRLARQRAVEAFDFRVYVEPVRRWLQRCGVAPPTAESTPPQEAMAR